MEKHLIKTIKLENGNLYEIRGGGRYRLASCNIKLEIYEERAVLPMLGGCAVKKRRAYLSICDGLKLAKKMDFDSLSEVFGFDIEAEHRREDGIFELLRFCDIMPLSIDLDGEWVFEVQIPDTANNLIN